MSMFNEKQNYKENFCYEEENIMDMFELDNDLEKEYECPICGHKVGYLEYDRYFICPECEWDGDFNLVGAEDGEVTSNILKDKFCSECGEAHFLELLSASENDEDDEGDCEEYDYVCHNCGHQGNLQDELDAQNYFWDEGLCGYDEDDKGEVFDWASQLAMK